MGNNGEWIEVPDYQYSQHRPTTRKGLDREMYGKRQTIYKKGRRLKPGSKALESCANLARALREIRHYQGSADTIIPRSAMRRLIMETIMKVGQMKLRISSEACAAIQLSAEALLVTHFELLYDFIILYVTDIEI